MGILAWIILGAAAGVIACLLTRKTTWKDYLINIVVGVLGAIVGGFITNLVNRDPAFGVTLISLIVSALGAGIFLSVASAIRRGGT